MGIEEILKTTRDVKRHKSHGSDYAMSQCLLTRLPNKRLESDVAKARAPQPER